MFILSPKQIDDEIDRIFQRVPEWQHLDNPDTIQDIINTYYRLADIANIKDIYQDLAGHRAILGDIMTGLANSESEATIVRNWSDNKHETFFEYNLYQGAFKDIEEKLKDYGYTTGVLSGLRYNRDDTVKSDDGRVEVTITWTHNENGSPVVDEFFIKIDDKVVYDLKDEGRRGGGITIPEPPIELTLEERIERFKRGDKRGARPAPTKKGEVNSYVLETNTVYSKGENGFREFNIETRISKRGHVYYYNTTLNRLWGYKKK